MISLRIEQLMPIPLKERLSQRQSGIWQQSLSWDTPQRIFVKAPSGAGKTTLIHLLYGLRNDASGVVYWDEAPLAEMSPEALSELRRTKLSVVFQDMRLFPELTAWENLELKRVLTNSIQQEEVRDMMNRLGLSACAHRLAHKLSYGEQQRVAIIRSLLQPFQWLLLDEPFSHLDEANKKIASALIESVALRNNASLVLAELDENKYFPYSETLEL
ncbi:MAG: ATP-binding cassette domain-containing protein [Bacteroidetes bacterium]|nr:ATP-binding cassette domain-containing protein [Bacteroidota bacterium]MBS1630256.1 ATP-binding cassette domain-containing protein [Bacteroidota bacterium]